MRDGEIYGQFRDFEKKVGNDLGLLLRTCSIIETRQKALEQLLFGTRLGLIRTALLALISPKLARKALMLAHGTLLRKNDEQRQEALRKRNSEVRVVPASTPVLNGLLAVLLMVFVSGCVPLSKYRQLQGYYKQSVKNSEDLVDAAVHQTQRADYCEEQQKKLVDVLRKFNQVDEKGNLREPAVGYTIKGIKR